MDKRILVLVVFCLLFPGIAAAVDFSWHGFGRFGLTRANTDNTLRFSPSDSTSRGLLPTRLDDKPVSVFGLQGSVWLNDKLSATLQLLSRGENNYEPLVNWAYLSYQVTDNLAIRAGRMRKPAFHYSDYYDVGYAYNWVLPPTSVYFYFGPFFNNTDSIDLYYQGELRDWSYSLQGYTGTREGSGVIGQTRYDYDEVQTSGLVLTLEKENSTLRLGAHHTTLSLDIELLEPAIDLLNTMGFNDLADNLRIESEGLTFLSLSASHRIGPWGFFAERIAVPSERTILPDINAWLLGTSRVVGPFTLHYTYGRQKFDSNHFASDRIGEAAEALRNTNNPDDAVTAGLLQTISSGVREQIDDAIDVSLRAHTLGLRYELLSNAALKFEVEYSENSTSVYSSRFNTVYSISADFLF